MEGALAPSVRASFLGEERTFALTLKTAKLLEAKLDMGCLWLEQVFRRQMAHVEHVEDVLRFALMGGEPEMTEPDVNRKIKLGVQAGMILTYVELCHEILCVFLGEVKGEDDENETGSDQPGKAQAPDLTD